MWSKQCEFISYISGGWEVEDQVLADQGKLSFSEDHFLAVSSSGREREGSDLSSTNAKDSNPIMGAASS